MTPSSSALEQSPSFYPEQYILDGIFTDNMSVVYMHSFRKGAEGRIDTYYFLYAQSPRSWRRVRASIQVPEDSRYKSAIQIAETGETGEGLHRTMSPILKAPLERILSSSDPSPTTLILSLKLQDGHGHSGSTGNDVPAVSSHQTTEATRDPAVIALMEVMDWGCPVHVEDEVVAYRRLCTSIFCTFCVSIGSTLCIETKLPFAESGRIETAMNSFMYELRKFQCLRECTDVAPFMGVVVDPNRRYLKSFLTKCGTKGTISSNMLNADRDSTTVPWSRRERWARQMIRCVDEVHRRGQVLGSISGLDAFVVDEKDDAKITRLTLMEPNDVWRHLSRSLIPPELRKPSNDPVQATWTTRCDLYQLGLHLWALALDNYWRFSISCCAVQDCRGKPLGGQLFCRNPHSEPFLPHWSTTLDVPAVYKHIVMICCSEQPQDRLSASTLLRMFDQNIQYTEPATLDNDGLKNTHEYGFRVYCDECRTSSMDTHYHCNICDGANFDLCESCLTKGLYCKDRDHVLIKRKLRDGRIIGISCYANVDEQVTELSSSNTPTLLPV